MNFSEIIHVAWEGIARNAVRSLLTMLGVIIGVAAVIVMISVSAGTEAAIADQINGLGANLVFVQGAFGPNRDAGVRLTYDDAMAIAELPDVAGMAVEMPATQNVRAGGTLLEDISILGTTPDFPSVREYEVDRGGSSTRPKWIARSRSQSWARSWPKSCSARKTPSARKSPWAISS